MKEIYRHLYYDKPSVEILTDGPHYASTILEQQKALTDWHLSRLVKVEGTPETARDRVLYEYCLSFPEGFIWENAQPEDYHYFAKLCVDNDLSLEDVIDLSSEICFDTEMWNYIKVYMDYVVKQE